MIRIASPSITTECSAFCSVLPPFSRLLALDLGSKTIGLAISDASRTISTSLYTIKRSKFKEESEEIKQLVEKESIGGIVLGYPINMNGTEGPRCQSTRAFATNLVKAIPLPLLLWDERMTTIAADNAMLEANLSRQKRAKQVDKLAASYMLQGVLDAIR